MTVAVGAELGDALYSFPTLRALGNVNVVCPERQWTRPNWPQRSLSLKRLAESQPYIHSWNPHKGEPIDLDLTTYRASGHRHGDRITDRIARWARVKIDIDTPWLECNPNPKSNGRIIINLAPRWRGYHIPYKAITEAFRKELLFVGTDDEYKAFCANYGFIERLSTKDHLEIAQAIAGSEFFIGPQSSCYAVAEGLKHPALLEICPTSPDCFFFRNNLQHYIEGPLKFTACGKEFSADPVKPILDRNLPPNGGYRITIGTKTLQSWDYSQLEAMARSESIVQQESHSLEEIRAMIERDSFKPIPSNIPRLKAA